MCSSEIRTRFAVASSMRGGLAPHDFPSRLPRVSFRPALAPIRYRIGEL
jgi:hypothetical protein